MTRSGGKTAKNLGQNRREAAAYPLAEAARYVRLAPATLRSWVMGRPYPIRTGVSHFKPLIKLPEAENECLSFSNLIEAHVLRALRTEHAVSIRDVRSALDYAEGKLGIERLLLSDELRTSAGELFLSRYGELINLSKSGQLAMQRLLDAYLKRVERDDRSFPIRLYPFVRPDSLAVAKVVAIDPLIAFGRPVVFRRGVSTGTIAARIDVGESVEEIAADYDLDRAEVEEAVLYERAA